MYQEQDFYCLLHTIDGMEENGAHILIFRERKYIKEFIEIGKMLSVVSKTIIPFEQNKFFPGGIKEKIGGREIFENGHVDEYIYGVAAGKKKII